MLTEDDIRDALRACYDTANPWQRPLNIVDLGLIESIAISADPEAPGTGIPGVPAKHRLTLTLIASSSDADAQTLLHAQIANRLAGLPQLSHTTILFAPTPTWTPQRLSPEARRLLQLDAPLFAILNNDAR